MRLYSILFCFLITASAATAQSGITLAKDNPIPALKVHIDPLVFDLWSTNIANTAFGVRADYFLNDQFSFYGGYKRSVWLDGIDADATDFIPTKGIKTHDYLEVNGYWHFRNKSGKESVPMVLSQSSSRLSGNRVKTTTKYLPVTGTVRKYSSIKVGLHKFTTSLPLVGYSVESNDLVRDVSQFATLSDTSNIGAAATNQYAVFLGTGLSSKKLINLVANSSTYGTLRNRLVKEIYFDLYWGISQRFDQVQGNGRNWKPAFPTVKGGGWRFGWRKSWNIASAYMEIGARPGAKDGVEISPGSRFYTMMGVGFAIGSTMGKAGI